MLVVDPRAHGLSDGVYNTVGFEEGKDAAKWAEFIHNEYGIDNIVFHGICIGAAAGMYAVTSNPDADYIKALVTEGMFANFGHSMRNHLIERKRNIFPIMYFVDLQMKIRTGHSMMKGPVDVIHKMNKPILMLQSLEDKYSTPDNAKKMFDICPSSQKTLVLFEKGAHSMLRITDTEKYDTAIKNFVK